MDLALACGCNSMGSTSIECDADGICDCKTDVIGDKCTSCKPGYSEFPSCSQPFYKSKERFIIFSIKLTPSQSWGQVHQQSTIFATLSVEIIMYFFLQFFPISYWFLVDLELLGVIIIQKF